MSPLAAARPTRSRRRSRQHLPPAFPLLVTTALLAKPLLDARRSFSARAPHPAHGSRKNRIVEGDAHTDNLDFRQNIGQSTMDISDRCTHSHAPLCVVEGSCDTIKQIAECFPYHPILLVQDNYCSAGATAPAACPGGTFSPSGSSNISACLVTSQL